jgi:hypothetical protein
MGEGTKRGGDKKRQNFVRNLGLYLTKDRKNVAWVVLVLALLPFLGLPTGWMCIVILGLMTLHKGAKDGLWVLAWALLPAVAISFWGYTGFLLSMAFRGLCVWILALLLRRFQSWAIVIEAAAVFGVVVVFLLHLLFPDMRSWWAAHLTQQVTELNAVLDLKLKATTVQTWANVVSGFATGLTVVTVLTIDFLLLILARVWQAKLFNPGGFRREFYQLRVGHAVSILLMLDALAASFGLAAALDVLPLLLLPFVFAGLSLLHVFMSGKKGAGMVLGMVYLLLVLMLPYFAILIALLGFADSWLDFRRRFKLAQ